VTRLLIRSLPYGDSGKLVYVIRRTSRLNPSCREFLGLAYGDLYDIKRQSRSFQSITAFDQSVSNLALRELRTVAA